MPIITTGSPFAEFTNSRIDVKVFEYDTENLDKYGNPKYIESTLSIYCLLEIASKYEKTGYKPIVNPGVDTNEIFLQGILIQPLELPINVKPPSTGVLNIRSENNRIDIGDFTITNTIQNPFLLGANINFENKIQGTFIQNQTISGNSILV